GSFLASTAQAIRASLLAKATAATLLWTRVVSWASHALRPEDCFAFCWRTARAPCTRSLRKYEFPRLLIPSSFCLPPVVYSPGTMPSHAENPRLEAFSRWFDFQHHSMLIDLCADPLIRDAD